jgi:hypothetical protein
MKNWEFFGYVLLGLLFKIIIFLVLAAIGWWLWGWIIVGALKLPQLTYLQFAGLMFLIRIILPTYTKDDKKDLIIPMIDKEDDKE